MMLLAAGLHDLAQIHSFLKDSDTAAGLLQEAVSIVEKADKTEHRVCQYFHDVLKRLRARQQHRSTVRVREPDEAAKNKSDDDIKNPGAVSRARPKDESAEHTPSRISTLSTLGSLSSSECDKRRDALSASIGVEVKPNTECGYGVTPSSRNMGAESTVSITEVFSASASCPSRVPKAALLSSGGKRKLSRAPSSNRALPFVEPSTAPQSPSVTSVVAPRLSSSAVSAADPLSLQTSSGPSHQSVLPSSVTPTSLSCNDMSAAWSPSTNVKMEVFSETCAPGSVRAEALVGSLKRLASAAGRASGRRNPRWPRGVFRPFVRGSTMRASALTATGKGRVGRASAVQTRTPAETGCGSVGGCAFDDGIADLRGTTGVAACASPERSAHNCAIAGRYAELEKGRRCSVFGSPGNSRSGSRGDAGEGLLKNCWLTPRTRQSYESLLDVADLLNRGECTSPAAGHRRGGGRCETPLSAGRQPLNAPTRAVSGLNLCCLGASSAAASPPSESYAEANEDRVQQVSPAKGTLRKALSSSANQKGSTHARAKPLTRRRLIECCAQPECRATCESSELSEEADSSSNLRSRHLGYPSPSSSASSSPSQRMSSPDSSDDSFSLGCRQPVIRPLDQEGNTASSDVLKSRGAGGRSSATSSTPTATGALQASLSSSKPSEALEQPAEGSKECQQDKPASACSEVTAVCHFCGVAEILHWRRERAPAQHTAPLGCSVAETLGRYSRGGGKLGETGVELMKGARELPRPPVRTVERRRCACRVTFYRDMTWKVIVNPLKSLASADLEDRHEGSTPGANRCCGNESRRRRGRPQEIDDRLDLSAQLELTGRMRTLEGVGQGEPGREASSPPLSEDEKPGARRDSSAPYSEEHTGPPATASRPARGCTATIAQLREEANSIIQHLLIDQQACPDGASPSKPENNARRRMQTEGSTTSAARSSAAATSPSDRQNGDAEQREIGGGRRAGASDGGLEAEATHARHASAALRLHEYLVQIDRPPVPLMFVLGPLIS
ncbi:hypothetical protein BESB_032940 [Besnoitia besnoiti]|uniref:Uncharacterized protein n=1 Tax=Besnoitia besnoiti TaxID=94643 RepID=A0A2A9M628_BESBE|nr:uncharacterized protein BESB_032940 [Besnoitia besnoiti]PFH31097.1 hypothetical protein BESB_032940 [Besnoitia besnoiti]